VLEIPNDGADAKYLTKTLNEADTEILRAALAADIHKFSQTPDFTDQQFSGNASGVALKYKLLSLETLAKTKERFFREGLKKRIELFLNILAIKGVASIAPDNVEMKFNRVLPVNEFEMTQIVTSLKGTGIVTDETLLALLPFDTDPAKEIANILAQTEDDGSDNDYPEPPRSEGLTDESENA